MSDWPLHVRTSEKIRFFALNKHDRLEFGTAEKGDKKYIPDPLKKQSPECIKKNEGKSNINLSATKLRYTCPLYDCNSKSLCVMRIKIRYTDGLYMTSASATDAVIPAEAAFPV